MKSLAVSTLFSFLILAAASDPCADISGKKWVSPLEARTCLHATPVDSALKSNVIEVLNKTLAFHTSTNYQVQAPEPFANDIHEDLLKDLAQIVTDDQDSDFQLHLNIYRAFKRVNDGHCGAYNLCYDSLYISYIPLPLVLVTEVDGISQNVYIASEAFDVASAEFGDEIEFWQNALPGSLKGQLASLSGARVLAINGEDPFVAVNQNALSTGGYQSFGTRQNSFFSSYSRGTKGWLYSMGNFAQQVHPLTDSVTLSIRRINSRDVDVITLPYRSRFGSSSHNFTDLTSFRANNCVAQKGTNGLDLYGGNTSLYEFEKIIRPIAKFEQQAEVSRLESRRWPVNVMLDALPLTDIDLPESLQPTFTPLNDSYGVAQFYMMNDNVTGVLALGSFSSPSFDDLALSLLNGLLKLKKVGASQLVVDVTNNGGGYICIAHWLHRLIIGPKRSTEPQAGLDTTTRSGPLAKLIVKNIAEGGDADELLLYNPVQWRNASNVKFSPNENWLGKPVPLTVNGRSDEFSQRLGQECQPFEHMAPDEPIFESDKVVIVSNGRCASSCSLFSITMAKLEGVKTVVVGGKHDVPQQYCGTVGGQSTDFSTIDTEIKSTKMKNNTLAPPDLVSNVVQGLTWRLGFGIDEPTEPEEWQDHPADYNLPLTLEIANNPVAIWESVVRVVLDTDKSYVPIFRVQHV